MYKTFWGLQKWLHNPLLLLTSPQGAVNLEALITGMATVLDNFAAYTVSDVEAAAADGEIRVPSCRCSDWSPPKRPSDWSPPKRSGGESR